MKRTTRTVRKAEKRSHSRSKVKWFVTLETSKGTRIGETRDVSRGGAFIYCDRPLGPRETFSFVITVPQRGTALTGKGKVVWSNPYGMGVRLHMASSPHPSHY
ncbi:MAG: PilZ domain-containing protein [Deltaproteobacteria bacterium]|nr:MAG: PilZ domain-containing protein [Deltaproteobacteria bacterium]